MKIKLSHGGKRKRTRRKPIGNAPMRSFRMTDELHERVLLWAKKHPDKPKFGAAIRLLVIDALDRQEAPLRKGPTKL